MPPDKRKRLFEKYSAQNAANGKSNKNSKTATEEKYRRGVSARKIAVIVALCVLSVGLVFGITYGFYAERIAGWPVKIDIQSFSFSLNGKECDNGATVTSSELSLAKGQEADFVIAVEAKGFATNTFCVPYQLDITYTANEDQSLARAIEVYKFDGNKYVFVSMLNEFIGNNGFHDGDISKSPVRPAAVTGINGPTYYKYKFVYSESAGDFYEGKSFSLTINAEHKDPVYTNDCYYIYSVNDFTSAMIAVNAQTSPRLTLVLLSNITLGENVTFTKKVGLDLNGYTLTTGAHTISITDNSSYAKGTEAYGLMIRDSVGGGTIESTGNGGIEYSSTGDVLLISDALSSNANVRVGGYTSAANTAIRDHFADNLAEIAETPLTWSEAAAGLNVSKGLKKYLPDITVTGADDAGKLEATLADGLAVFSGTSEMTIKDYIQFSIGNLTFENYVTVLGTSPYAVAEYYADKIPQLITGSLFFPTYDPISGSTIMWVSGDNGVIDPNGTFLPSGYEILPDWTNRNVDIGMIIGTGDDKYTKFITREAEILSPEERTRILYSYPSLVLDGVGARLDIKDGLTVDAAVLEKLGFNTCGIEIEKSETASNLNYTGDSAAKFYADYAGATVTSPDNITLYQQIECAVKPKSLGALVIPSELTFYFRRSNVSAEAGYVAYSAPRQLMLVGTNATVTLDDATITLQPAFTSNDYISKENARFSFLAEGSYDNGSVFVDYAFKNGYESWSDRIDIVNGLYIEDAEGLFVRNADGSFRLYTDADGNAVRYNRKSLIIVKPAFVTTVTDTCFFTAKLISLENAAPSSETYENSAYL